MRIRKIHIEGFGVLHDVSLELSPGMNIMFGSNESGKTTLFEFIHRILYGFPRGRKKKDYNPYASIHKTKTGGRLLLEDEKAGLFSVERYEGENSGDSIVTRADGGKGLEEDLVSILSPITQDMYRDVFAFGVDELRDLQEESLKRFYSAGLGLKNVFVSDVLRLLETRSQEIFKTTRGETSIRKNITKINAIQKEIHGLSLQKDQYDAISLELKKTDEELISIKESHDRSRKQFDHDNLLKKALPLWVELSQSQNELSAIPVLLAFPQQALVRLEKILDRISELENLAKTTAENLSRAKSRFREIHGKLSELSPDIRESPEESLPGLLDADQKDLSMAFVFLSSLNQKKDKMETLEEKKRSLQSQLTMAQMNSAVPLQTAYIPGLIAPLALAITGIAFMSQGLDMLWSFIIVGIAIILSLVHILSTYGKLNDFRKGEDHFAPMRKEIDTYVLAMKTLADEIEQDKSEIATRVKKIGISALPTIEEIENKRIALNRLGSELRDCKKDWENSESSLSNINGNADAARKELAQLLEASQAPDIETFRRLAAQMEKRTRLEETIKSTRKNLMILGFREISPLKDELEKTSLLEIEKRIQDSQVLLESLVKAMNELRQKKGELLEKRRMMELDRIPELRAQKEQALAETEFLGKKWRIYRLAAAILQKAREKYEREKQPRVLQEAGLFFKKMTAGKYHRIGFSPEEKTFLVFDYRDNVKNPILLSRGAREQMYFAIRFGLIRSFESNGIVLPLMTDDILVNFDPERSRGAAQAFMELSQTHQTLFFTCHPETANIFKEFFSDIMIHQL
ncbi:AAA family ATPase [Candidatus Sumerlaeota bacterium]|nr:AAA family ATPase [Candidatus Sumerlaeota bacterium]